MSTSAGRRVDLDWVEPWEQRRSVAAAPPPAGEVQTVAGGHPKLDHRRGRIEQGRGRAGIPASGPDMLAMGSGLVGRVAVSSGLAREGLRRALLQCTDDA